MKGAKTVISHHKYKVSQALLDLFPNIGLDKSKFWFQWAKVENRRKFFENFANLSGFDPLIPNHWYKQSREKIMATKVSYTLDVFLFLFITLLFRELLKLYLTIKIVFQKPCLIYSQELGLTKKISHYKVCFLLIFVITNVK
jgi:hypothetical protein